MTSAEIRRQAIEAACAAVNGGWPDRPETGLDGKGMRRSIMTRAIDAFEAAMWRPISEAPGDRTPVLVWDGREVSEDFCATTIDRWVGRQEGWGPGVTHFHPLPAPPQDPETKP